MNVKADRSPTTLGCQPRAVLRGHPDIQEWKNPIGSPNELQVDQAGLKQFGGLGTDAAGASAEMEKMRVNTDLLALISGLT
jgi:hypothetical protein